MYIYEALGMSFKLPSLYIYSVHKRARKIRSFIDFMYIYKI